jgi:hypothetical protein
MNKKFILGAVVTALFVQPCVALAASDSELQSIREQIRQLKAAYEERIAALESRLQIAESAAATRVATEPAPPVAQAAAPGNGNSFNPEISLILSGTYGQFQQDAAMAPTGFAMAAHIPPEQGFNLGESELGIRANIDTDYRGVATLALSPAGGVSVENAYVQTSALGNGMNLSFGRFFSGLGYLNAQHAHAWDFTDQPLVYRSFWNNQLGEDGLQLKWLAPTDTFVELGAEIGKGRGFPGTDRAKNGSGASALFAHIGDDFNTEQSWQAGISWHQTRRENAQSDGVPDRLGTPGGVSNLFSGDSRTLGADFVWKYARNGNPKDVSLKVQGEYFRRRENGLLTYDLAGANTTDSYAVTQNGWYVQGVYQFMPQWRTGLRYDRLDPGIDSVGPLNAANIIANYAYQPTRASWMLDYSPSEFSRLRLQLARDLSRQNLPDNQLFVQYIMSLGAHGAHTY